MTDAKPYTLAEESKWIFGRAEWPRIRATVEALERAERERDAERSEVEQLKEIQADIFASHDRWKVRAERAEGELAAAQNHLLRAERAERDLNRQLAAVTAERDAVLVPF